MTINNTELIGGDILKRFGGNIAIFSRAQKSFLAEAQAIHDRLLLAQQNDDVVAMQEQLHALKGVAATMGAQSLAKLASYYETEIKSGATAGTLDNDGLERLSELIIRSDQALAELAASL